MKEDNTMFYQAIGNSIQANKDKIEKLEKQNERLKKKNKTLQFQLKAKEEVIKEAREYIDTKVISNGEIIDQLRKIEVKKLLEILSKGENK